MPKKKIKQGVFFEKVIDLINECSPRMDHGEVIAALETAKMIFFNQTWNSRTKIGD